MATWTETVTLTEDPSDVGGDDVVTDNWTRVWQTDKGHDGLYRRITVYGHVRGMHINPADHQEDYDYYQPTLMVEFMEFSDPEDAGGSEVWTNYHYEDYSNTTEEPVEAYNFLNEVVSGLSREDLEGNYPWVVRVKDRDDTELFLAREGERLADPEWTSLWDSETETLEWLPEAFERR